MSCEQFLTSDLVVPSADAVDRGIPLEEVDRLAEVREEVWGDVEVLLQDDHVLRQRVDVERSRQGGLKLGCEMQKLVYILYAVSRKGYSIHEVVSTKNQVIYPIPSHEHKEYRLFESRKG